MQRYTTWSFATFGIAVYLLTCAYTSSSSAGTILIDGANDWILAAPGSDNLGHIGRDTAFQGQYIWRDRQADERTDFSNPDAQQDLLEFRVTGDSSNIYFYARMRDLVSSSGFGATGIQIAIDTDRSAGSGTEFFGGFADTTVNDSARWERLLITRLGSGNSNLIVWDTGFTNQRFVGVTAVSDVNEVIEISLPWSELGLAGPPATALRFTVANFSSETNDDTRDLGGSGISNALDCITNFGNPGTFSNTWDEVSDGRVDYFFDVYFESDGDVYPPLLISEVLPVPSAAQGGDTGGEFI
ncbi:MAG: hypothetical protein IPK83_01660, partial [Planctomycetes bacterium]|nr:hypothetical protein [Planctomycetota bacterium]